MVTDSSHIIVDSCFVENTEASGIMAWDSDHVLIINNKVRNACVYEGDQRGAQECISLAETDTFQVLYNEVYESPSVYNGGEGIDTKESCTHGEVAYNLLHDNVKLALYVDCHDGELSDISVHSNVVYNNYQGIAVSSEAYGVARNVQVFNNLVVNNSHGGIMIGAWCLNGLRENITIFCNTVLDNGYPENGGGIGIQDTTNATDITFRNNIVSGNNQWQIMAGKLNERNIICDNNLVNNYRDIGWWSETRGTNYLESDPGLISVSESIDSQDLFILKACEYILQANSIAIDNGSQDNTPKYDLLGNRRPTGAEIDLGAIEFSDSIWNQTRWRNYKETVWDWPRIPDDDELNDWVWTSLSDKPRPQDEIVALEVDEKIYVFGSTSLEEYDIGTNTWYSRDDIPAHMEGLQAVEVNGKIYAIGGRSEDNSLLSLVGIFDPVTNTWKTGSPIQTPRAKHAMAECNGKIYVFGGFTDDWVVLDTVEEYDPTTDTWTYLTPMPIPAISDAVSIGNKIIITCFGWNGRIMEYDTSKDSWKTLTTIPTLRGEYEAVAMNERLYIIGGRGDSEYYPNMEEYTIVNDSWKIREPMQTPRARFAAVEVEDKIYVIGGLSDDHLTKTVEVYGPFIEPTPIPEPDPDPANIIYETVSIAPHNVETGNKVIVTVNLRNTGDLIGSEKVELYIDNVLESSKIISVSGGGTKAVTFEVTKQVGGTFNVEIGGKTASFTVNEPTTGNEENGDPIIPSFSLLPVVIAIISYSLILKKVKFKENLD